MKTLTLLLTLALILSACASPEPVSTPESAPMEQVDMENPASAYCEQQGYQLEIRTADDGSQAGYCIFPDGSECDEWAFYRGECSPEAEATIIPTSTLGSENPAAASTVLPTPFPVDPDGYQGWWTYIHAVYGFSIMLPGDWVVEEITTFDPEMSGHTLTLRPEYGGKESIRMAFRKVGEEARLWPTGVGQGEFIDQATLDVAGAPARRMLLVCPTGEVTAIWYHGEGEQPNIVRDGMEFGFIYSAGSHCEEGYSLAGKLQWVGDMIVASLQVP